MSRFPLLVFFGLLNTLYVCMASVEYGRKYDNIVFIPEHSNEWLVRIDEGKTN
jgi:hypothetical protein